ncbi:hypothetical protein CU098_001656, partial [Rhizopus stolonifer]
SKAETQTVYITRGYAWTQSDASVTIYVQFKDAYMIEKDGYVLHVKNRSIELDILNYQGANHKFKLSQLYDCIHPRKFIIKFKENKIVIILYKQIAGKNWPDLRIKSTQAIYNDLERLEKQFDSTDKSFDSPFQACPQHK